MAVKLPTNAYRTAPEILAFYADLNRKLETLPGVQAAGAISELPLTYSDEWGVAIQGKAPNTGPKSILLSWVVGDAMKVLRLQVIRGRLLGPEDTAQSPHVLVVNQAMAQQAWPNENPIGKRISLGGRPDTDSGWSTVVGVVADLRQGLANLNTRPHVFQAQAQASPGMLSNTINGGLRGMHLLLLTSGDPNALAAEARATIGKQDSALPVTGVQTLDTYVRDSINPQRFDTYLFGLFAAFALLLAVVGIGSVLWYTVARRTNEIGVRMALGGANADIIRLILHDGLQLSLKGIAIGLAAALLLSRLLSGILYQTSAFDVLAYTLVPALLIAASLLAAAIPAWRAVRIDPIASLRGE
jgi:predicted permease